MITPASFVIDFPEFGNQSQYPVSVINYYIALARLLLNPVRWGSDGSQTAENPPTTLYDMATELFVAHHITLEYNAQRSAAAGAPPGQASGPVTSKAAGPISVSYATGDVTEPGAGHWNYTVYGQRFYSLLNMAGMGPTQFGIGCAPYPLGTGPFLPGAAWIGPVNQITGVFWNT